MESILADVRQSFRMMRKSPAFTAIAIAALALGIGANTAIFTVVNRVLLQPLPYPEPDRLVKVGRRYPNGDGFSNSITKYMVWRNNHVFSSMALYDQGGPGLNLSTGDRPVQIKGLHVSKDFFKVFGVGPLAGRTFTASEDGPNGPRAAVMSEKLWRSRFGSDPNILGKTVVLNGEPYPVVGLIPGSFAADPPADIWIPLQADPASTNQGHFLAVAARLKDGVTLGQARGEMKVLGERFRQANPKWMDKNESVAVVPMRDAMVRDVKTALFVLVAAVVFVLLIACGNVANLLLARAAGRQRELAIRAAVGASRKRIMRQLLTESVILAALGGVVGLLVGAWGVRALLQLVPGNIPRLPDAEDAWGLFTLMDWRIALFTVAISFLTGIVFGLFPALHISRPDVSSTLKEASSRSGTGRRQNRARKVLVGAEMALAVVLLTGAALLVETFVGLSQSKSGIDPHGVMTLHTSLAGGAYSTTAQADRLTVQVVRRLEALPGVAAAAVTVGLPTQTEIDLPFNVAGRQPKGGELYLGDEQYRFVSPHYFAAFRIPLLRGRLLNVNDTGNSAKVLLINQTMANKYWPKQDPVGQVMVIGKGLGPQFEDAPRQVVGVVGDVREISLREDDEAVMYVPQSQIPDGLTQLANGTLPLAWVIRSSMAPASLRTAVEREFRAVDGQMSISKFRPMEDVIADSLARQHFNMLLLSLFAGIALLLAAIGIYGVMSYAVEQQMQELGIRMALGAAKRDVMRLIVGQGMTPALLGVATGLAIAFGVTRLLASMLYGVKATDPFTFGSVAVLLLAVALLAMYVPARRGMRIDPAIALREG